VVAPDLHLTERSGLATLTYLGEGALTSGLSAGYLTGDFTAPRDLQPAYEQTSFGLVANYAASGQSVFKALWLHTRTSRMPSMPSPALRVLLITRIS